MGTVTYLRMVSMLGAAAIAASACTGSVIEDSRPTVVGMDQVGAGDGTGTDDGTAATPGTAPGTDATASDGEAAAGTGDAGADGTAGTPAADGTAGAGAGATSADGTTPVTGGQGDTPSSSAGGGSQSTAPPSDGSTSSPAAPTGPREANLFNDREKTIGISDDRIHLCGHAALIFADAFDVRPEDLNTYWTEVNANGGIHGRRVTVSWKDDAYSPDNAVQAAQSCKAENPFLLLGGIGFDQIPAVRNWAEANRMLYLHHIAPAPSSARNFSFSYSPTVDDVGRAFGEHMAKHYADQKVGIAWRQSENWEPGHRTGRAELDRRGVEVVADLPVQKNQGVYSQQIFELQSRGAEVVWLWENALVAAQFIQQAYDQGYRPRWIVFPFQVTLDVLGDRAMNPPMDGVATWPAYTPGGYGGAYAEHDLDGEIARFEAAYAEHRPNTKPNDLLWQTWVGNKILHDALQRCGPDCNRNRLAGLWLSGYANTIEPGCHFDFGRANSFGSHLSGYRFYSHQTFETNRGPQWKNTAWCREHLS